MLTIENLRNDMAISSAGWAESGGRGRGTLWIRGSQWGRQDDDAQDSCGDFSFPMRGEVEIGGLDVYSDGKELRRRIGYVPDFFGVYDNLKVSEYMEFLHPATELRGCRRGRAAIRFWNRCGWKIKRIFSWTGFREV